MKLPIGMSPPMCANTTLAAIGPREFFSIVENRIRSLGKATQAQAHFTSVSKSPLILKIAMACPMVLCTIQALLMAKKSTQHAGVPL